MLLGWDTDQFPTDIYMTTKIMLCFLKYGGLGPRRRDFDAKVRRESFEPVDLFHAHVGGMDCFAAGLKLAAKIRAEGDLSRMIKERYGSWDSGVGPRSRPTSTISNRSRSTCSGKRGRRSQQERASRSCSRTWSTATCSNN